MSRKISLDGKLMSLQDKHLHFVYNDPDFYKTVDVIIGKEKALVAFEKEKEEFKKLAKAFAINLGDIKFFLLKKIVPLKEPLRRRGNLNFNHKTGEFFISFSPDISQKEFMEIWAEFDSIRKSRGFKRISKRRLPEQPELLYAIFKARQNQKGEDKKTFGEIFTEYQEGKLAGYSGNNKQFTDEDVLEDYYHTFYPSGKPLDKL